MGADLNNIIKTQTLSDDHVQFLVYQILRGLKVRKEIHNHRTTQLSVSNTARAQGMQRNTQS